ncbi:MAG: hypothetical protein CVU48_02725 [Candidatus Cloacimonetes bacterium HGW-Cloacimonetes-1]|jgi:TolA-binding protein/phage shock protein A|nr:MAG: hypothetical protein CVU48_02725 [Candidatus Cloacimonetes bacterium HGW-Cloacimonetes-1]
MKNISLIGIAIFCILLVSACGIDNTMYNAKKYFRLAQERPLNANGKPVAQSVADYTKTIQKCGVILTERKDSQDADDALFLMAKALYYKGNSAFQAKDQFDNLIKAFPYSPFVPEAYIYLAKVNREINRTKEAKALLEEFIRKPQYRDNHPQALLTLADFELKDKDFVRAQYWLEKIISEYPKTKEFAEAYFLFGKNYYLQKDYAKSLHEFKSLVAARRIGKDLKMDGNYYIALNLYYMKDYQNGYRVIRKLINNEYRTDKIAPARVLKARYLLALRDYKDADQEMDYIVRTYPRTAASAEAQYIKAQYQYYTQGLAVDAIASYNRVRSEFNASDFAAVSQIKATALTHIIKPSVVNVEQNLQQFTDYQFQAADYFVSPLELPDSALVRYDMVLKQPLQFRATLDSLQQKMQVIDRNLDSLRALKNTPGTSKGIDSMKVASDSTDLMVLHTTTEIDSLADEVDLADTLQTDVAEPAVNPDLEIAKIEAQKEQIQTRITSLENSLTLFQNELIPFCYFAKGSIYKNKLSNLSAVDSLYALMLRDYPDDKYTISLNQMRKGEAIRLIDKMRVKSETMLDTALGYAETMPDSMLIMLNELTEETAFGTGMKADFRLGWYYTFEAPDTLQAKEYFNRVLADPNSGDYGLTLRRFYDGKRFLFSNSPLFADSVTVIDSVRTDSLFIADSLAVADSLNVQDSTAVNSDDTSEIPPPEETPELDTLTGEQDPKDIIKQEELPTE